MLIMNNEISDKAIQIALAKKLDIGWNGVGAYVVIDSAGIAIAECSREEALAAQAEIDAAEVTDAEIEEGAQAIYVSLYLKCEGDDDSLRWDDTIEEFKKRLRQEAKAIIEAARKARKA